MAFVRMLAKNLGSPSAPIYRINKNVHSIRTSTRLLTTTPILSAVNTHKSTAPGGDKSKTPTTASKPKIGRRDELDVSFNDPNAAFKSKTTFELIRAYFVYLLCSSESLVENNMKVMII